MNKDKTVVTGGAGFIGSHIVRAIQERGFAVTVVDDLSSGSMTNLAPLMEKGEVEFIKGSITDPGLLKGVFTGARYVFHQAALASIARSMEDPLESYRVNLTGTLNTLLAARDAGVEKMVMASSCAVYGDIATLPLREDMAPQPLSPYAATKLAAEQCCAVFTRAYGLPTVCLRYFNVYGPRQRLGSAYAAVIPSFIASLSRGEPPIIYGDGAQTRDFVYVEDVVAANILAAEGDFDGVYNIASGRSITIKELVQTAARAMGIEAEPIHKEGRPGDIRQSSADISKAAGVGYKPLYDITDGLKETIKVA